jgi:hypothetical protein
MYLDVLNDNMVGFANISARKIMDYLFRTYCTITAVDLEINFEHMSRAWYPQQPVESMFKQIQDCAYYSEVGGVLIGHPQQINFGYAKIFATGHFMSACRRWNENHLIKITWTQFNPFRCLSPSAQANAGRIYCNSWLPLRQRQCRKN